MASYNSYPTAAATSVPGLEERPSAWSAYGMPNCDACKETYVGRPLLDACGECEMIILADLTPEDLLRFDEGSRNEPAPSLIRDLNGGFVLPIASRF